MIKCDKCGNTICSNNPTKCPFCNKIFISDIKRNVCPTCSVSFQGTECPFCGDEVYGEGNSSFYQDCIEKQEKKKQK